MNKAKPTNTHVIKNHSLSLQCGPKDDQERAQMTKIPYTSAIGSLMYAMTCTRPELAFAVGLLC